MSQADEGLPHSQLELEIIRALIQDATRDTILWLAGEASEQERVYVREIQGRLADLDGIITRRELRRSLATDAEEWCETRCKIVSLLQKAKEVRGCVTGRSWALLTRIAGPSACTVPTQVRDQKHAIAAQQPAPAPKSWQELEIAFLSDERVEICWGGTNRKTYNYAELGFQDRRNEIPNRAWVVLRELAKKEGTIPRSLPGKDRARIQKRMEEIRKKLRGHFNIEADPIPFNRNTYQASFKISCRPSFKT